MGFVSFMKFSLTFCNMSSTRMSQLSSDREKFMPDGFQECSQETGLCVLTQAGFRTVVCPRLWLESQQKVHSLLQCP
jgi:hypothetical protein